MRIAPHHRPARPRENVVPMINIVFLLLIFVLMTAQIAPPEPIAITPPEAEADTAAPAAPVLHLGAGGGLAFGDARDAQVWPDLAALPRREDGAEGGPPVLLIRADAALPGAELAAVLARLSDIGLRRARLVTLGGG